jgi:hypothetical protein
MIFVWNAARDPRCRFHRNDRRYAFRRYNHNIDALEGLDHISDDGDPGRLADVGHEALGIYRRELCNHRVELLPLAAAYCDLAALFAQKLRDGETDAACAAGDQRRLAG